MTNEVSKRLVGYWNGDTEDWVLSKFQGSSEDQLVIISLETVKVAKGTSTAKLRRDLKKLPRDLRNLIRDTKKWRK